MVDESYTEEDSTPSQRLLDQQTAQADTAAVGQYQGRLDMARGLVIQAVAEGANSTQGREILGDLDQLQEFPDLGDRDEVYSRFRSFIKGQGPAASHGTASESQPPTPKKVNLNKARRDYIDGKTDVFPG